MENEVVEGQGAELKSLSPSKLLQHAKSSKRMRELIEDSFNSAAVIFILLAIIVLFIAIQRSPCYRNRQTNQELKRYREELILRDTIN